MSEDQEKISIIIPVYNMEAYIDKCLSSVVRQSYKNIEIIVVIDGSTDMSEEICQKYADEDDRIIILKQENKGLSAARNLGLDHAGGTYVMFVDSDDYVSESFCEIPYKAARENEADLVIFDRYNFNQKGIIEKKKQLSNIYGLIDQETAIDKGRVFAWNKLYHIDLFQDIRYPEGRVYEDIATTHKLVYKAHRIVMLNDKLYYRNIANPNSITHERSVSNRSDSFHAYIDKYNDLVEEGYPEKKAFVPLFCAALRYLTSVDSCEDDLYEYAFKIVDDQTDAPEGVSWNQKMIFRIWKRNQALFHLLCRIFHRRVK